MITGNIIILFPYFGIYHGHIPKIKEKELLIFIFTNYGCECDSEHLLYVRFDPTTY